MATNTTAKMLTAGKLAEALGVPQGRVKKMLDALRIKPDDVQHGCSYYGPATLSRLKAELKKSG